jgi:hypothetical protein
MGIVTNVTNAYQKCIDACNMCAQACYECFEACLNEADVQANASKCWLSALKCVKCLQLEWPQMEGLLRNIAIFAQPYVMPAQKNATCLQTSIANNVRKNAERAARNAGIWQCMLCHTDRGHSPIHNKSGSNKKSCASQRRDMFPPFIYVGLKDYFRITTMACALR